MNSANEQSVLLHSGLFAGREPFPPGNHRLQERVSGTDEEAALVNLAQSGDKDAFSSLINRYLKTLYKLVLRITKNHEDAEDTVQDAILKAYANLSQFQKRSRFSTWLGRIAINEALMRLRKRKPLIAVTLEELTPTEEFHTHLHGYKQRREDPESLYAQQEIRERMLRAAGSLIPIYHTVFLMTQVKGWTLQETADELKLSVTTVKARVHRARKQLREILNPISSAFPV